jgi:outer membrane protein TolC
MEQCAMRHFVQRATVISALAAVAASNGPVLAQTRTASSEPGAGVRRLSIEEAVDLALEQNLGIQIERMNPRIQDLSIAQARGFWAPNLTSTLSSNSQNTPSTSFLSGGASKITDSRFSTDVGLNQMLPTGARYSVAWSSYRATSNNIFSDFDPQLSSNVNATITQPLLKNFRIDNVRQQLALSRKEREASDVQLHATVTVTTRNVRTAYWDLAYQIDNLKAQQQSLDLAKRLLADNEKRVQIGTMAPIDIVEAQSEVARNEEAVIVAAAAIKEAEDRLRALIFDPSAADFWTVTIEPSDRMLFEPRAVDTNAAVQRALANRTDVQRAKNSLSQTDINVRYFHNQTLPEVNAEAAYTSNAVGGVFLSPLTALPLGGGTISRSVVSQAGFGSVLGDVFSSAFPTWRFGLAVSYPLGSSTSDANLARAKLQYSQGQAQLRNLELQIATEVRSAGRQVETNAKRVDSARAARELAERRLEAEEKKFAAGIQISFFVFQAQRDLAQARTNEIRAIADYNKSLVDFEAIQDSSLTGGGNLPSLASPTMAIQGSSLTGGGNLPSAASGAVPR